MERPVINIARSKTDRLVDGITIGIVVLCWLTVVENYRNLPEIIPMHFGTNGKADGFGSKIFLYLLPILATLIVVLFSYLITKPHIFNYSVNITGQNAEKQYRGAITMLRWLKLIVAALFLFLVHIVLAAAVRKESDISKYVFVFVALLFLVAGRSVYLSFKNK